jgi:hypothetical protein
MSDEEYRQPGTKHSIIKLVLRKKIEAWLDTIKDENVRKIVEKNVIVTGGCIASMLLGESIKDYDVYLRTKEATLALANYYVNSFNEINASLPKHESVSRSVNPAVREAKKMNCKGELEDRVEIFIQSAGVAAEGQEEYQYFEGVDEQHAEKFAVSISTKLKAEHGDFRPIHMSQNAITLSDKVQCIIRFFGEPDQIHRNFDFVHATAYFDYAVNKLVVSEAAYKALLSKSLIYTGSLYPMASVFRVRKFIQRGWRITAGQMLKMLWQVSELELTNRDVLQEQLLGVDQAYMWQLMEALKDVEPNKIDAAYIAKIIDDIFD